MRPKNVAMARCEGERMCALVGDNVTCYIVCMAVWGSVYSLFICVCGGMAFELAKRFIRSKVSDSRRSRRKSIFWHKLVRNIDG